MKLSRSLAPTLIYFLLVIGGLADVVSQPIRKYGLGDLIQVAISANGQWMATSGSSGAFLWNYQTGVMLHRLEAHHSTVGALCFSPDSQILLTGGRDAMIREWDVQTGAELRAFQGHLGEVSDLSFSPNGETFVSAGDNAARVWDFETGEQLHTLAVPGAGVFRALFTPDGNRVVTASGSLTNSVRLWNLANDQMIRSFGDLVQTFAFVSNQLVTSSSDVTATVWDIETGQVIRPLEGATQLIIGFVPVTNSSLVIAGCINGQVVTWDTSTGDVAHNFFGENLVSLVAIPGTNQILTAHDKLVRVKERTIGDNIRVFGGHTTSTTLGVGFSPDGRFIVSGGTEIFTRIWNRTNAQPFIFFPGHGAGTETATYSPDGTRILTTFGGPIHSIRLSNAQTGNTEREFFGHTGWPLAAEFSPNGQQVVSGAQDGTARLWDVATGTHIRTFLTTPGLWIRAVAVSSNNTYVAGGGSDGIVRLWNGSNAQLLRTFELNAGSIKSVAFSPANGHLLVAWEDGFLRTFDPATGELKLDSITPAAFLDIAVFSPDGRFILGGEGWPFFTARLWDARNGQELRVFTGHAAPVDSVAFNSTGTSILTGSDIVRLWSIADIAARLESERKPNGLELRWHVGTLQQSSHITGPWTTVTNATSPWFVPADQPSKFFRVAVTTEN